jgi:hypothetical protein
MNLRIVTDFEKGFDVVTKDINAGEKARGKMINGKKSGRVIAIDHP